MVFSLASVLQSASSPPSSRLDISCIARVRLACDRGACSSEANEDAGARDAARNRRQDTQLNCLGLARHTTCAAVSGAFTPAVTESETTRTCANDNGRCCNHYNKREDSHRTTLIILLKTPYAIGTIAALFLHLLLPEDRVLDEEKEGYPRAFSDGEIAYES